MVQLHGIGPQRALAALRADRATLIGQPDWHDAQESAENQILRGEHLGVTILGATDPTFLSRLLEIPRPPAILFVHGDPTVLGSDRSVAIVGTRRPTPAGVHATERIAGRFAASGWIIVSGLALRIDTIAHQQALAAATPTIAVLGNGLDTVYAPKTGLGILYWTNGHPNVGPSLSRIALGERRDCQRYVPANRRSCRPVGTRTR